jgi:pyrroline-5-carboxylate reductase
MTENGMKLVFLGAGKMATAIAAGIVEAGVMRKEDLLGSDISAEARSSFASATGGVRCVPPEDAGIAGCDVLVLAVKPQSAAAAVEAVPPLKSGAVVISIAAGVRLERLIAWFGTDRVIRCMPNTPLMVGYGATVFSRGPGADDSAAELTRRIFGALGIVEEVDEGLIDGVTALSGSGPAYVFELIQALTDAGVAVGLPDDLALELTVQTVAGATEMLKRRLGSPDELRAAVTSRGGTTAAGLAVLERAGFRDLMTEVVRAARDRSVELGKQM